jgi:hypothetical protein
LKLLVEFSLNLIVECFFLCLLVEGDLLHISCSVLALWRFEVLAEIDVWVASLVVLLDEFVSNEELGTLVALEVLAFLLLRLLQKVFIGLQRFSLHCQFAFQ